MGLHRRYWMLSLGFVAFCSSQVLANNGDDTSTADTDLDFSDLVTGTASPDADAQDETPVATDETKTTAQGSEPSDAKPFVFQPRSVSITCQPKQLVLGTDRESTLVFDLNPFDVGVSDVHLHTSVGSIGPLRQREDGKYVATYTAPGELYPHLAILALTANVEAQTYFGWTVLPLLGQGEVTVPTQPRYKVSLQIGDKTFGPVRADREGLAKLVVQVPPGHAYGLAGKKKIPLGVAPFARVLVVAQKTDLAASRHAAVAIHILAVDERGMALENADLQVSSDLGQLTEMQPLAPGHYLVVLSAGDAAVGATAKISAHFTTDAAFSSGVEVLVVEAPKPPVVKQVATVPDAKSSPWPWYLAAGGGGLGVLAGVSALAIEGMLSLSDFGSGDERMALLTTERVLVGVGALALIGGAVGGGLALATGTE